jgi:hypothetical protein
MTNSKCISSLFYRMVSSLLDGAKTSSLIEEA